MVAGVQMAAGRPGRCRRPAHPRIGSRAMPSPSLSEPCICNNNAGHGHTRIRYDADAILPSHLGITRRLVLRVVRKKILVLRAGKDVRHAVDETERERDGVAIESEWSNGGGVEEEGGISRHAARAWGKKKLVLAIHVYSTVFFLYDPAFLSFWIDPRGRSGKRTALLLFFSFFFYIGTTMTVADHSYHSRAHVMPVGQRFLLLNG
jgi:hypothetical protein